jgi:hypothetical protein
MKMLIGCVCLVLWGCSTPAPTPVETIIYKSTPLTLPSKPTLPVWSSSDMQCLTDDIKQKMLDRDRLRKNYIEKLEAVILTTQQ